MMGTDFVENRTGAALFNCAFRSTKEIATKGGYLFQWMMDALMVGIGVGFDTLGAETLEIKTPGSLNKQEHTTWTSESYNKYLNIDDGYICVIDDSREGWVESVRVLLNGYYFGYEIPKFVYSEIREAGEPIKGFGGTSSGYQPLKELHEDLHKLYTERIGELIQSTDIVDTENLIGRCVVAGNVRRSAALALGNANDVSFLTMKNDQEKLMHHRWGSNNSFHAIVGQSYDWHGSQIKINGEPGAIWLDNARTRGRFKDAPRDDDLQVMGFNPCVTGDTWVPTDRGYKQVVDLVNVEDLALQVNGKYHNALSNGFWQTGIKGVFKLTTREGYELKLTADHKVLTLNRSWVEAKDLRYGDRIVLNNHRAMQLESIVDHEHAKGFLLGLLVGDGTFASGEAVLSFWDPQLALAACNAYEQVFESQKPSLSFIENRNEWHLRRHAITQVASEYGITQSNKKNIDQLIGSSNSVLRGFLRGLFDTDGTVISSQQKGVSVRLCQNDLQMLKSVQRMLLRLGITSTIYQNRREAGKYELPDGQGGYKLYSCKAVHELVISDEDLVHFNSQVGFASTAKQERLSTALTNYKRAPNKTKFYAYFDNLEYLGEEAVYDVTVEDVHAFDANGLYVHNCVEQQLEDAELCCLVETYPALHDNYEDWISTLKIAYLYAKTVTLAKTQWPETNQKMLKNRRIGLSVSGHVQSASKFGRRTILEWYDSGYEYVQDLDAIYSDWMCIPRSRRTTSVKPSGTVSLLNGSTPGIHYPESEYYIRRIRFANTSPIVQALVENGYHVEDCQYSPNTKVVSFPVHEPYFSRGKAEVSMWEQLEQAAQLQYYWADNSVSVTVTFKPEEADDISKALELYESRLKAVSFLQYKETGYVQAPYEPITKEQYEEMSSSITPLTSLDTNVEGVGEKFCDGDSCVI